MKIRTDFVTNSSSVCYTVDLQLKSDRDEMVSAWIMTSGGETKYSDDDSTFEATEQAKSLNLYSPCLGGGKGEACMMAMFEKCESLEEWAIPQTWPVEREGAIPMPTSTQNEWWSKRDARWMSVDEIRSRGRVADTFMRFPSAE